MCGIGGIFRREGAGELLQGALEKILRVQDHRGPDASGTWVAPDGSVGLSHNRLAIIDLSCDGNQPMVSADGRYVIVFNGEIYNYLELREELQARGSAFRSRSDTEVLLEGYRQWGEGMLVRLRGMFAFALYDTAERVLLCARDRQGKKPFVYAQTALGLAFASEIPALAELPGVDRSFDNDAIAAMLLHNLRHVPDPYTAYRGIRRLRPGHSMVVRAGRIERIQRYWQPSPRARAVTPAALREVIEEAVRLRMRADVPVGALLSGGIDSTAVVALMKKTPGTEVNTYALGLDGDDEDLRRARVAARALGTRHREFHFDPQEQWDIFQHLLRIHGEPIMVLPLAYTYSLCRAIHADGMKVVMSGNGADELFYGYLGHVRTYRISNALRHTRALRPALAPLRNTRLGWAAEKPGARKANFYRWVARNEWKDVIAADALGTMANRAAEELAYWGELCPSAEYIDESNFVALMVENTHSVTIAGDLPAMAASVEVRSPFLDQEVVSFALATPANRKIPDPRNPNWLKAIMRDAVADLIPAELLAAPKRGFGNGIQEDMLFRGPWRRRVSSLLEDPVDGGGLFSVAGIRERWRGFEQGKVLASQVAKQVAIQSWLRSVQ